jgi:hypothetical protein
MSNHGTQSNRVFVYTPKKKLQQQKDSLTAEDVSP